MSQNDPPHEGRTIILTFSFLAILIIFAAFTICLSSCSSKFANDIIRAIELEQKFEKELENAT